MMAMTPSTIAISQAIARAGVNLLVSRSNPNPAKGPQPITFLLARPSVLGISVLFGMQARQGAAQATSVVVADFNQLKVQFLRAGFPHQNAGVDTLRT
jgi:hypothetical protein